MKTRIQPAVGLLLLAVFAAVGNLQLAAADAPADRLQQGLLEEEANRNPAAAIPHYQAVVDAAEDYRRLAAAALYRLAECSRKLDRTNDAVAAYQRLLRDFGDHEALARLSRETLAALAQAGASPAAPAGPLPAAAQRQVDLLVEELGLVDKQIETAKRLIETGRAPQDSLIPLQRDALALKRQIAEVEARGRLVDLGVPPSSDALPRASAAAGRDSAGSAEIAAIEALTRNSPDLINAEDASGLTPLQSAAAKAQIAVVRYLLDHGAEVNGTSKGGVTALHHAAFNGHKAVVDLLLERGARPDASTEVGVTPLHFAVFKGHRIVAETLIGAGASIHATIRAPNRHLAQLYSGDAPLALAVRNANVILAELLLKTASPTDSVFARQKTYALYTAASDGQTNLVQLLLEHGADVNGPAIPPGNALFGAVVSRQPDAVALLLERGADPNPRGTARIDTPTGSRELSSTALHVAVALEDTPLVELLLAHKADPNILDAGNRSSPFMEAVHRGNLPLTLLLLEHGADVNRETTPEGGTWPVSPLWQAVAREYLLIARLLLERGANPNVICSGLTPLHLAVRQQNIPLVELLLAYKADPNVPGAEGETPLELLETQSTRMQPYVMAYAGVQPPLPAGVTLPARSGPVTFPSRAIRSAQGSSTASADARADLASLLRKHGADENRRRRNQIAVSRPATGFQEVWFTRDPRDRNQHTLLELIAHVYSVSANNPRVQGVMPGGLLDERRLPKNALAFPDLSRIRIHRLEPQTGQTALREINVTAILESSQPAHAIDVVLEWGDIVEIPEDDHPRDARWGGLDGAGALSQRVNRTVTLTVKGETSSLPLFLLGSISTNRLDAVVFGTHGVPYQLENAPSGIVRHFGSFRVGDVLRACDRLRVSSDLSRVRVVRSKPLPNQWQECLLDLSDPAASDSQVWLRDGDQIEVPEKLQ